MKNKKLFVTLCFTVISYVTNAQEYATDAGATWLSGMAGYSHQGGDLYGKGVNTIVLTPSFNQFLTKNFFIGLAADLGYQSQGNYNSTILGIGPHLGAAVGTINSKVFPYFSGGIRYHVETADYGSFFGTQELKGTDLVLGVGVMTSLIDHVGLSFEATFHFLNLSDGDNSESGNNIALGIGITGLFFKGLSSKPVPEKK